MPLSGSDVRIYSNVKLYFMLYYPRKRQKAYPTGYYHIKFGSLLFSKYNIRTILIIIYNQEYISPRIKFHLLHLSSQSKELCVRPRAGCIQQVPDKFCVPLLDALREEVSTASPSEYRYWIVLSDRFTVAFQIRNHL
jgi:hypothetical protein